MNIIYTTVKIGDIVGTMLVDTGSNYTCISSKYAHLFHEAPAIQLLGINDTEPSTHKAVKLKELSVAGPSVTVTVHSLNCPVIDINDAVDVLGVLGQDFLIQCRYCIDGNKFTLQDSATQ